MEKQFAIQSRNTVSRMVGNIPTDWTDVTVVNMPNVKSAWHNQNDVNAAMEDLTAYVLNPLAKYLKSKGFDIDFSRVSHTYTPGDTFYIRADWLHDTAKHAFTMLDDNTQGERREDKHGNTRGYRTVARCITDASVNDGMPTIIETCASGAAKFRKHTYLDLFSLCKPQIEHAIGEAVRKRKGGHVKVRMINAGSVVVTGGAN